MKPVEAFFRELDAVWMPMGAERVRLPIADEEHEGVIEADGDGGRRGARVHARERRCCGRFGTFFVDADGRVVKGVVQRDVGLRAHGGEVGAHLPRPLHPERLEPLLQRNRALDR